MKKNVNGVEIQMTEQEISERQARIDNYNSNEFNRQLEKLRDERNELLAETDWTVLSDSPIADKTAWQNYRTELRNLTNGLTTVEDIETVVFPTKPEA